MRESLAMVLLAMLVIAAMAIVAAIALTPTCSAPGAYRMSSEPMPVATGTPQPARCF